MQACYRLCTITRTTTTLRQDAERFNRAAPLVVGHTDNMGELASNTGLSKRRVDAVVAILATQYRANPKRLGPVGVSFASTPAPNTIEDGIAKHRCVELVQNN